MPFPKEFVWGVATAAYQIEGAAKVDGRGESIWDRFSHTPGRVLLGHNGDEACDHYHRYEADLDLMVELGILSYRFSIAWPRIIPDGKGQVNQKGIDFYRRLVEAMLVRGISPMPTLYHWDLPQALEDQGGWTNRATAYRFAEYADVTFGALGDLTKSWITHNEPWCAGFLGYGLGQHAPGHQEFSQGLIASHHVLLSHGLAMQALRSRVTNSVGGITLNLIPVYPATSTTEDAAGARRVDGFMNRWFLDPVLRGEYPADMQAYYGSRYGLDFIKPGDLELIAQPTDFLGINYYSRQVVRASTDSPWFGVETLPPQAALTDMEWEIVPDSLTDLLVRLKAEYGDLPLYITENGAAFVDQPDATGFVDDQDRIAFLEGHMTAMARALAAGVNLKGYYLWSFLDNFEWAWGYTKRFGIVYVDYETQRRRPKQSALWYRRWIRERLPVPR
jgi:beta-glucosidase